MTLDVEALLRATSERTLRDAEVDAVVEELVAGQADDPYSNLLLIGRASAVRHRPVVEEFLNRHDDPMLVRVALQILCKFWSMAAEYEDRVMSYMKKSDWDPEDDVRQMALSIAGEHLRVARNPEMLRELLRIIDDENEEDVIRCDAYVAIARAMGKEWGELPKSSRLPPMNQLIDPAVRDRAFLRYHRESQRPLHFSEQLSGERCIDRIPPAPRSSRGRPEET